ncbi:MAG: cellulase family glycosylhydrolase [Ruminococcus sp.]|nr:cellulase family glycosylhydrolase [Ruminococcus sp.]
MLKNKFISKAVSTVASVAMVFTSIPSINVMDKAVAADKTMTAFEITKNMKVGWNLGNTLDAKAGDKNGDYETAGLETETSWGCPKANQQLFDALKAKGFNTVRVPTTWFQHLDANNNIDPEWMARVKEVVDYGIKNDMYIILNVHHENWINRADFANAYNEMQPKLMKIWTQIAEEFKDYDQHLIFECMNEPRAANTDHEWWAAEAVPECEVINHLEHDFVDLIRSTDGPYAKTRLLMLPGYVASAEQTFLKEIDLPENDDFLAVSIHAYTPYDFTMNTAVKDHSTFTGAYSQNLADTLQGMRDLFIEKDIPVVIGEMGTSNFGNTEARVAWTTQYFTTTKKYGIPCCLWDNNTVENPKDPGECHGYINRTTGEWHEQSLPIINKMMEIMNDDTIVWGSEGKAPEYKHQALSEGKVFRDEAVEIDASKSKTYENTTPGQEISWSELEGKEVAIKYTGTTPVLAFSDAEYGNWTEFKPYTVDEENGIAYYLVSQQLPAAWNDLSTVNHMQARTDKVTTIEKMVILNAPEVQIDVPVDKTKKYKIDFANAPKDNGTLVLYFEGEPNTTTNGAVGFNGDGWEEVKWEGKTDSLGKLTVEIDRTKFPADLKSAECQIWYQPELVDMKSYEFSVEQPGTVVFPTETTTTETTTITTATTTADSSLATTTTDGDVLSVTVIGDANLDNRCSVADAVAILQHIANQDKYALKAQGKVNADVDGQSGITANDALTIQRVDAGVISESDLPLAG